MSDSTQHTLDRVRMPRVQITYDVDVGGAQQQKELPFVIGVLADLSGNPVEPLPRLKDRGFVETDRDNFNDVLAGMKPRLTLKVDNKLSCDASQLGVELNFRRIEDFGPYEVAMQIEPLRKLIEARNRLSELLAKMDGNDALVDQLEEIVRDTEKLKKIQQAASGDPARTAE